MDMKQIETALGQVQGALSVIGMFVPQVAAIEKLTTLVFAAAKAGQVAVDAAAMLNQVVIEKKSLTPDQSAKLEAEYERVHASIQRPLDPPPGSG